MQHICHTQALFLFSKGKKPIDVSIELDLPASKVQNMLEEFWALINIICSNLNSQIQGDENNVAIATPAPEADTNYGAPFP
jgi:hypothetical protein